MKKIAQEYNRRHTDPAPVNKGEIMYEIVCDKVGGGIHRLGPFPLQEAGNAYKSVHLANKVNEEANGQPLYKNIQLREVIVSE